MLTTTFIQASECWAVTVTESNAGCVGSTWTSMSLTLRSTVRLAKLPELSVTCGAQAVKRVATKMALDHAGPKTQCALEVEGAGCERVDRGMAGMRRRCGVCLEAR